MMKNSTRQWTSGRVKYLHPTQRLYVILSKGKTSCYRRNRKFLQPTKVNSNSDHTVPEDAPLPSFSLNSTPKEEIKPEYSPPKSTNLCYSVVRVKCSFVVLLFQS